MILYDKEQGGSGSGTGITQNSNLSYTITQ